MAIRYKAWALALFCCSLAASAMADDDEGAYVALNVGRGSLFSACKSPVAGPSCVDNRGFAYFATYGYQYTPMWGLEASYGKLGSATSTGWDLRAFGLSVAAVATLHMGDFVSVFARAGLVRTEFKIDITPATIAPLSAANSPIAGVGLQFDFTPKLALRVQADYFGAYTIYSGAPRVRILANSFALMSKY